MFEHLRDSLDWLVGPDYMTPTTFHMCIRAFIVYVLGIILARINKRFVSMRTVFNFMIYAFLGSIVAAGITGQAPFFPILGMVTFIMLVNWLILVLMFYSSYFEYFIKGSSILLVEDGKINKEAMRKGYITEGDLKNILMNQTGRTDLNQIDRAIFDNTGQINIVLKNHR